MRIPPGGFHVDNPAFPLVQTEISYWNAATANGNALGTTLVCAGLANEPSYQGQLVKMLSGNAAGQIRPIFLHPPGGNTLTVTAPWTDNAGAAVQITAGSLFVIISIGGGGGGGGMDSNISLPYLIETWQDVLGIDFTVWTTVLGGTGAVTRSVAEEPYQKVILTGPVNADTARLHSVQEWMLAPDTYGTNTHVKALKMEWEGRFVLPASIDNALFLMGMSAIALATRATNNIAGFILVLDALNVITDDGGVETVTPVPSVPDPLLWHKYKILAYPGTIEFWVDEVREVTHTTAAAENLPDVNAHGQFYLPQEALANGGELHIGTVGIKPYS